MKRRLWNLLAAATLLLCGVVCLFWVRSRVRYDAFHVGTPIAFVAMSEHRGFAFTVRDCRGSPPAGRPRLNSIAYGTAPKASASPPVEGETRHGPFLGVALITGRPPGPSRYPTVPTVQPSVPPPRDPAVPVRVMVASPFLTVQVRHSAAALVLAGVAGAARFAAVRSRRWTSGGRCASCGYDLRATPQRCPECGGVKGQRGHS